MTTSTARVPTDRPARYGKQLVAHLTRRATGAWDADTATGWLRFDGGEGNLRAVDAALELVVQTADGGDIDRLEDVVGRHLVRFGARDELVVQWTRDDGSPGGLYRGDGTQ